MSLLHHHILALILTAATTLGLGLLVFLADPKRRLNQVFGLYSLTIAWWAFWESISLIAHSQKTVEALGYFEWLGVIFIAPTFVHTVFLFADEKEKWSWTALRAGYAISGILAFLHLALRAIMGEYRPVAYVRFFSTLTPIGLAIPVIFFLLVNLALWKLRCEYGRATGNHKTQLRYLFWASLIGYLGGSPDWFLVFGFYVPLLNPFGIYCVPLYSIAITYAIFQHRLFDIHLVIRKSLIYSILVTLLTTGYFGLIYGAERLFRITLRYQSLWISLSAFALMALMFQPLKIGIQRFVDRLIFRGPMEAVSKRMERLEQEARQTEKLRAVATLAAGLSHELRNPLQVIQTHAEFLPERYDDPEFRRQCSEAMRTEIARVNVFLKQLMDFAHPKLPAFQATEPHKILDSTLDLLSNEFVRRQVQLEKRFEANGAIIQADPDQIRQIILNLTLNALEAIGRDGTILVKTRQEDGYFALELTDSGPGIDPKVLPKLFEPFTTTKPDGNGLGLSIVHSIVREHRGKISVQSQPGQGTTFVLKIPVL